MAFRQDILKSLNRTTRLAIRRKKWRWGKPYDWTPRPQLIRRISQEFGLSYDDAYNTLIEIKHHIRRYPQYF